MTTKHSDHKMGADEDPTLREEARAAFERVRLRLDAVAADAGPKGNLQATRAIGIVLAAQPKIADLIPQLRRQLPEFPTEQVHELRDLALAAYYAIHRPAATAEETELAERIAALVTEGTELRRTLQLEAEALARRKLLPAEHVSALRGGRGYTSLADALLGLSSLFRDRWKAVKTKTGASQTDVARAQEISVELVELLGSRAIAREREATGGDGQRALALLVETYDEVRSAVLYLRRKEKDGRTIAPSLYLGRRRRAATEDAAAPELPEATPAAPSS